MWSNTKKQLDEFICDSLKNRVKFFFTKYRQSHDQSGRVCILVDNVEVFDMSYLKYNVTRWRKEEKLRNHSEHIPKYQSKYSTEWEADEALLEKCIFTEDDFFSALRIYFDSPIEQSINSENVIVIILALIDRRIGKRTLSMLCEAMKNQKAIVQYFYKLRCEAEGVI